MIQNAKEAKALGLAWLDLKFRLPDGSRVELKGPYSKAVAIAIFKLAQDDDPECTKALKAAGQCGVPS